MRYICTSTCIQNTQLSITVYSNLEVENESPGLVPIAPVRGFKEGQTCWANASRWIQSDVW